jgi:hypothetical protein
MRYPVRPYTFFIIAIMIALGASRLIAQETSSLPLTPALGNYLNPDGTLNLTTGFNGSLDARGWRLSSDASGGPRFERVVGDENWDDRFGPPGTNGTVYAILVNGSNVYIGGRFSTAGTVKASNIARWNSDTKQWSDISNGLGGAVYALAVSGDEVYAGGIFMTNTSTGYVARWSPSLTTWDILGDSGITPIIDPINGLPDGLPGAYVYAMAVLGNDVYIGGDFVKADRTTSPHLIKWNRSTQRWTAIRADSTVRALVVNGDRLYAAGFFKNVAGVTVNNIAQYDTISKVWTPLGTGINGRVNSLAVSGSVLYAGGDFTTAGGVSAKNVARWDRVAGTWSPLGGGVSRPVRAITVMGSDVYVGGDTMQVGSETANGIARWNGAAWSALGIGVGDNTLPVVNALASGNDSLYIGGKFSTVGSQTAHNIAGWDTKDWFQLGRFGLKELNLNGTESAVFAVSISGSNVYIGGDFTKVGGIDANYIVRWDITDNTWHALGTGIGGQAPFVRSLAVNGGSVYVGGIFSTAGGVPTNGIALWNGSAWSTVGGGMGGTTPYVFALGFSGSDLYAGGAFDTAGTVAADGIARWNGSTWSALGSGISNASGYSSVNAIAIIGTSIYVGGDFTLAGGGAASRIARWNGSAWSALGTGMNAPVSALAANNDTLYAGGEFTLAGGTAATYIAKWNGTAWSAVDSGFNAPVRSLVFSGGSLYAGGEFTASGATQAGHIARLAGTAWQPLQSGPNGNGVNGPVRSIAVDGPTVFAGGEFSIAGGLRANNIAEWNGTIWSSLGSDPTAGLEGPVLSIALKDTNVYVGGLFTAAGGMRARGVARWDGHRWLRMGRGINGPVRALAIAGNDLYAAGEFDTAGTVRAIGIARWNGSDWSPLGEGLGGPKPYASALAVSGTDLYIGGGFDYGGGVLSRRVIRYNTTAGSWHALGSGIGGGPFFTYVTSIAVRGNDAYIGGVFPMAGSVIANNIAHWNIQSATWSALGTGINNSVLAVAIDSKGDVYAGGSFTIAGDVITNNIARWDGTKWSALGEGLNGDVYTMGFYTDELFAGGAFVTSGSVDVNHVGRWNGVEWVTMGGGVEKDSVVGRAYALATYPDGIYVGGDFTLAGGRPSYYFGHWRRIPFSSVPQRHLALPASPSIRSYPNPATSTATIAFTLPSSGHTRLTVVNARGEEMVRLLDGHLASGDHTATVDLDDLAVGVYYCRIIAGDVTATVPLVVTR